MRSKFQQSMIDTEIQEESKKKLTESIDLIISCF